MGKFLICVQCNFFFTLNGNKYSKYACKKYDNGIPTGVKKLEVVKLCRSLKYDDPLSKKKRTVPSWTTPVEIAYEDFIKEFNKQTTPKPASDSKF